MGDAGGVIIYRLKVSLRGISPMIWRGLLVPDDLTLYELHRVLQMTVGWEGYHLHAFRLHGRLYNTMMSGEHHYHADGREIRLADLELRPAPAHPLRLRFRRSVGARDPGRGPRSNPSRGMSYPMCIGGARAGPPEDSGGPGGYHALLDRLPVGEDDEDFEFEDDDPIAEFKPERFQPPGGECRTSPRVRRRGGGALTPAAARPGRKVMHFAIQLVSHVNAGGPEMREIASIDRPDDRLTIDDLGLMLAESKAVLAALQVAITDSQVLEHVRRERPCPCCGRTRRLKDRRTITVRTCFGKLALPSPRFARCSCEAVPGIAAPLVAALPERVTPDLLALEARWASLAAYQPVDEVARG